MNKFFSILAAVMAVASLFNTPLLFIAGVFAWGADFIKEEKEENI